MGQQMEPLEKFPITRKWPPGNPTAIQLYSATTPNGVKIFIALEELDLPYEAHFVSFERNEQFSPEFRSLNPNAKIPAIIDPDGPGGKPLPLFESGAILIYLAEKAGRLLPADPARRHETIQWLMFQMGGVGPMFGQMGWFVHLAGQKIEDPRPRARYVKETARLLRVIDRRLEGQEWIMDNEYSIADIAIAPWIRVLRDIYKAADMAGWSDLNSVPQYLERFLSRPAVQIGLGIPERT